MNTITLKKLLDKHIIGHDIGVFARDRLDTPQKRKCAFVWNTDPHTKSGQHWVALYISKEGVGYYFDSYGKPPQHREFVTFLKKYCKRWMYNSRRVQDEGSRACGHFCVYFLIHMAYRCKPRSVVDDLIRQSDSKVVDFVYHL